MSRKLQFNGSEMSRIRSSKKERGSSLIEMLIALLVLSVGMVGSMAVVGVAVGSNARSKRDTTSTALAQMVLGRISSVPVGGGTASVTVTDCANNTLTVNTTGTTSGSGANLSSSTGKVDFSQSFSSVTSGYAIQYIACGMSSGIQTAYDIRWNIKQLPPGAGGVASKEEYVVVGARAVDTSGTGLQRAASVNLRTIVGNDGN
ncbi:MAG TPA: prepilin-type N-terminal cleavage/methylation domain-containing protein [Candidatus Acidoferrales bacterium]|nr:prepilin-type N-terminal cleavage/methylation domain-containing protein [Candidatus Acidoferrales bacterium]